MASPKFALSRGGFCIGAAALAPAFLRRDHGRRQAAYDASRFEKLDKVDGDLVHQEKLREFDRTFPQFAGRVSDKDTVEEMLWINVWYRKPLTAERRIMLRYKIRRILDANTAYSDDIVQAFVKFLEDYGAL